MKSFEYYREKILNAVPYMKERWLKEAAESGQMDNRQMDKLVELAGAAV